MDEFVRCVPCAGRAQPGAALPVRLPHTDVGALPAPIEEAANRFRLHPPTVPGLVGDDRGAVPGGRDRPYASCSSGICWNRCASGS